MEDSQYQQQQASDKAQGRLVGPVTVTGIVQLEGQDSCRKVEREGEKEDEQNYGREKTKVIWGGEVV